MNPQKIDIIDIIDIIDMDIVTVHPRYIGLNFREALRHDGVRRWVLSGSKILSHFVEGYPLHVVVSINPFNKTLLCGSAVSQRTMNTLSEYTSIKSTCGRLYRRLKLARFNDTVRLTR
jgi:hypothetical protein